MWRTIGQPEIISLLKNGLDTNNLSHAYLLTGPIHVGKTTLALDLAQALNCLNPDTPCGKCNSCNKILNGKHPDVLTIDLNSNKGHTEDKQRIKIGINEIREIERSASLFPYEGKHKVFIINGAENLSIEAANCFLKTLEEPPPGVMIILLTSDEANVLPTLVSRCQRLELKPLSVDEIKEVLIKSQGIHSDKAKLLARLSNGYIGWALMASTDEKYLQQRNTRLSEMFPLFNAGWGERFSFVAKLENDRKIADEILKLWLMWWHDLMLVKCDCNQLVINIDHISTLEKWSRALNLSNIKYFIDCIQEASINIQKNVNLRLVFEVLMLDMPGKEEK